MVFPFIDLLVGSVDLIASIVSGGGGLGKVVVAA
jgi:hypothetical protein